MAVPKLLLFWNPGYLKIVVGRLEELRALQTAEMALLRVVQVYLRLERIRNEQRDSDNARTLSRSHNQPTNYSSSLLQVSYL